MATEDKNDVPKSNLLIDNKNEDVEVNSNPGTRDIVAELMKKIQAAEDSDVNSNQPVQCGTKNSFEEKLNNKNINLEAEKNITEKTTENWAANSILLIDNSKNTNRELRKQSIGSDTGENNRKRKGLYRKEKLVADEEIAKPKRRKSASNDDYCWRCNKDCADVYCSACPRSWHRKCCGLNPSATGTWICAECDNILKAENVATRTPIISHLTIDQLCMVFRYVIERMRNSPGAEPFWSAVDLEDVPNYLDYVIKPMDLSLLESNVDSKLYGSIDAFMADAKWIQHNCIVFNTCGGVYADTTKLSNAAKQIVKIARQEISEFEACPDCYMRGRNIPRTNPSWFIETCRQPHPLIWAKLKGFPFWPAKALPRINSQGYIDVRFFGEHDRAWVSQKDIYLYSREPPTPQPRKKKLEMVECIKEITRHCKKLELNFGPFTFAPTRTSYNPHDPMQIKILLPEYDPLRTYDLKAPFLRDNLNLAAKHDLITKTPISNNFVTSKNDNQSLKESKDADKEVYDVEDPENIEKTIKQKDLTKPLNKTLMEDDKVQSSSSRIETSNSSPEKSTPKRSPPKKTQNVDPLNTEKNVQSKSKQFTKRNLTDLNVLSPSNGTVSKPTTRVYKPKSKIVGELNIEESDPVENPLMPLTLLELPDNDSAKNASITSDPLHSSKSSNSTSALSTSSDSSNAESSMINVKEFISSLVEKHKSPEKRESKAKKSFPNRPPPGPNRTSLKEAISSINSILNIPISKDNELNNSIPNNDNELNYQLPPPEAGPLSARLNKGANELVRQMARLIEDALKEAAESKINNFGDPVDTHEATIYALRLQIERMRWQHQQQIAEYKHNADRTLREMRTSMEVERNLAIEEMREEAEEDKTRCILETKSKQWCTWCQNEAFYFCCWNTAYCNETCQQIHWKTHMNKCSHESIVNFIKANTQNDPQQSTPNDQFMPTLFISAQKNVSDVRDA